MDIEYAKFTSTPTFVHRGDKGEKIINSNPDFFIKAYHVYHQQLIKDAESRHGEYLIKKEVFENKKCHYCGGKMRYISSYDFWGCSNYKLPGQHSSLSGQHPFISPVMARVNAHWITDIIYQLNLKGKVTAKELYKFYIYNDLEDLRLKYGYDSTEKQIEGLNKAKRRSLQQEEEALKWLQTKYKVAYQQCITYKLKDQKEKFCIPDFIFGNEKFVFVFDAKLDYVNDDKMDMYCSLVKYIIKLRDDKRTVIGGHILWPDEVLYTGTKHRLLYVGKPDDTSILFPIM